MPRRLIRLLAVIAFAAGAAEANPGIWQAEWPNTDFSITDVDDWKEILSGGPPKDGIPAITGPDFISAAQEDRLGEREPIIAVEIEGETPRAYPIRYLTWHEIVNDMIGGTAVAVTFCPLCNSGIVFDRRVGKEILEFGVSGKLRNSDMVMYDRNTESWWQQAVGTGIVGHYTGTELTQLPSWMESWSEFQVRNPEGLVMDRPGTSRPYGRNPYVNYDSSPRPFLYRGEPPPHDIPALARVVRVGERAWLLERLREDEEVRESGLTIRWNSGQASALDTAVIADGRDVGTIRVRDGQGHDVPHDVMFAFAFHAFFPEGKWMLN